jgi:hypothetical protein
VSDRERDIKRYAIQDLDKDPEISETARKIIKALGNYNRIQALIIVTKAGFSLAHALLAQSPPESYEMNKDTMATMWEDMAKQVRAVNVPQMIADAEQARAHGGMPEESFFAPGSKRTDN